MFILTSSPFYVAKETAYSPIAQPIVVKIRDYIPRDVEANTVVSYMTKRQLNHIFDKSFNPLIATPAGPGIGKSTFLANFPASPPFENYASKHHISDGNTNASPIVAPLTFNSQMNGTPLDGTPTLGLRILYGAARSMRQNGILMSSEYSWPEFLNEFIVYKSFSAVNAVAVLRSVYGNRRVLLLIDELSKADDRPSSLAGPGYMTFDRSVMRELAQILDSDKRTDVIVSSVSPNYVDSLLAGSRRPIDYVPLPPLQNSGIGRSEANMWGLTMAKHYSVTSDFVIRMLCSTHLLVSGHPRYLNTVIDCFAEGPAGSYWKYTVPCLSGGHMYPSELLLALCGDIGRAIKLEPSYRYPLESTLSLLLSVTPINIPAEEKFIADVRFGESRPLFQGLLETNEIYIVPTTQKGYFLAGTQLYYLIRLFSLVFPTINIAESINMEESDQSILQAAKLLFQGLLNDGREPVSTWWERTVALTIASRAAVTSRISTILGVDSRSLAGSQTRYPVSVRLARTKADMTITKRGRAGVKSELIMSYSYCPGFDARLTYVDLNGQNMYVYMDMKITPSSTEDMATKRANALINTLVGHYNHVGSTSQPPLNNVHMVFYEWAEEGEPAVIMEEFIQALALAKESNTLMKTAGWLVTSKVKLFIDTYARTNVHFTNKSGMDRWVIPSLTVIPRLVEQVASG